MVERRTSKNLCEVLEPFNPSLNMTAVLLLLLVVAGQTAAILDCPFPKEDLPTYQQVAKEVLASLTSSSPKDILTYSNAHNESLARLQCASASPDVRTIGTPIKLNYATVYTPILWPDGKLFYTLLRSNFSSAALARLEVELNWVNNNTCVTLEEVASCSALEKCVVITPPSEETLRTYTPAGCPPDDFTGLYYVSRTAELVESHGILDWIMWILGFLPDHNRYDRDDHLAIIPMDGVDEEWMNSTFLKNVQSIVHTVFPYDPQSASHITLSMAASYGVNLTTLNPDHVIKNTSDEQLSLIDVQKIHYYYCHETLTFPVSSLPPELEESPADTTDATASNATQPSLTETTPATTIQQLDSTVTTTTTTTTTADPRFTLIITLDGFDDETLHGSLNTTTSSSTMYTTVTAATTATPTTTFYPMTSTGVVVSAHSFMGIQLSSLLLVAVLTCWLG